MQYYNQYIVTDRFKNKCICGEINLPFGTVCRVVDFGDTKAIVCDKGLVCCVSSQVAYDHFSQNDDLQGIERGRLVHAILNKLSRTKRNMSEYNVLWDKIWNDEVCLKHKRSDHEEHFLFDYSFYNATISDLQHIAKLVGLK